MQSAKERHPDDAMEWVKEAASVIARSCGDLKKYADTDLLSLLSPEQRKALEQLFAPHAKCFNALFSLMVRGLDSY